METISKEKKKRGCLKKVLVFFVLPWSVVMIAFLIWAGLTFVYWGPDLPKPDHIAELQQWSADSQGTTPDDHRAADAFEALYNEYVRIEKSELGLEDQKRSSSSIGKLATKLWDPAWFIPAEFREPDPAKGWEFSIRVRDDYAAEREAAERLLWAFDAAGLAVQLDEVLELPGYIPRVDAKYVFTTNETRGILISAHLETLRARLAIEAGEIEGLLVSLDRILRLQEMYQGSPIIMIQVSSQGCTLSACELALAAVDAECFDDKDLRRIDECLAKFKVLSLEVIGVNQLHINKQLALQRHRGGISLKRTSYAYQSQLLDTCFEDYLAEQLKPRGQRNMGGKHYWDGPRTWVQEYNNRATYVALPSLSGYVSRCELSVSMLHGSRVMVALERHRLRHNELPVSLDQADRDLMPENTVDFLAGDGVFRFRVHDEPDYFGRRYTLYSVGMDGNDDGGLVHCRPFSAGNAGTDILFNRPPWNYHEWLIEMYKDE